MSSDCFICNKHHLGSEVPGGVVYEDDLVYVGHILPGDLTSVYLGYVMVEPKRHVRGLADLTAPEAAAIGRTTSAVARALVTTESAEHVYSFVLGDAVDHLHTHVVPRYSGAPTEYWGPRVDQWPDAPRGGESEIAAVVARLGAAMGEEGS